ncbi:hypothetical protein ACKVEX_05335 [Rhodocyclaceae bacterium SMB388]
MLWVARLVSIVVALPAFASEPAPLLPEASDPVLGHRAAVVEWAWSPQYAERFGLPVQDDGLEDGYLWLIGIKVVRMEFHDRPTYRCRIVGLLDNQAPIVWPPGERYVMHPSQLPMGGGLPGQGMYRRDVGAKTFTPGHSTWHRFPKTDNQRRYAEAGFAAPYLSFHRGYDDGLAYFELEAACAYFGTPQKLINRLSLPTEVGQGEQPASRAFKPEALSFDIPDRIMLEMFRVTELAADWTLCLMHRSGMKNLGRRTQQQRDRLHGVSCEPVNAIEGKDSTN